MAWFPFKLFVKRLDRQTEVWLDLYAIDPELEEIGIQSPDDLYPQVAMTAATMLGNFGSPASESSLDNPLTLSRIQTIVGGWTD